MTVERKVDGAGSNGRQVWKQKVYVRVTSDEYGATLSLSDDTSVMLIIPLESVKDLLEVKI